MGFDQEYEFFDKYRKYDEITVGSNDAVGQMDT